MSDQKVWLITGASQGLGYALATAALAAGHHVIATARDPETAAKRYPNIKNSGGEWLKLDIAKQDAQQIVADAVAKAGRIDVLINNAGSSLGGTVEDTTVEECMSQMNVNAWGALRVTKGVLPTMRAQRSGTIVNQGSIFGNTATLGLGAYSFSKACLDSISETLRLELRDFNIRVLHLVTGFFRTALAQTMNSCAAGVTQDYMESEVGRAFATIGEVCQDPEAVAGDPAKLAGAVIRIVDADVDPRDLSQPFRIPLGRDGIMSLKGRGERSVQEANTYEEIATNLDFDDFDQSKRFWPGNNPVLF